MGARAAENALAEAGWQPDDIDVIIGACGVMEQPIPSTAVLIQNRLGLGESGIPAFDMNATCLSFLIALDRALAGFALGEWERALIVSSDIATAALDYSDPEASVLFSDGAAAFALDASGPHTRLAHRFATFGEAERACRLRPVARGCGSTKIPRHFSLDQSSRWTGMRYSAPRAAVFRVSLRTFWPMLKPLQKR